LLDDKQLDWRVQIELQKRVNWFGRYDRQQQLMLKNITIRNWKDDVSYANSQHIFKLTDLTQTNQDATKYGTAAWSTAKIRTADHLSAKCAGRGDSPHDYQHLRRSL
jgi:hypothetical protein